MTALKKPRENKKFAYVVALARTVNALNSAHSLMMTTANRNTPDAIRDRMKPILCIGKSSYETLKLIRAMSSFTDLKKVLSATVIPARW